VAKRTIRQYLILTGLHRFGIGFIAAIYVTFLISKGLNLFEVNMINFIFFTTLFICEIPTGAFADVFGRKTSYVAACLLYATSMFVYGMSDTFWGFGLAEIIGAVGATCASGAFQAWLVDKLSHHGYEGKLTPIFAREQQVTQVAGICGAITGAALADISLVLPWIVGGAIILVNAFIAIVWMREEYFVRKNLSFRLGIESMVQVTKTSINYGINHKTIRFILVVGAIQFIVVQAPNMQWQPYFKQFIHHQVGLGILWALMALGMMVGAMLGPGLLRVVVDERRAMVVTQVLTGIGIILAVAWNVFPAAVTFFILHEIPRGMFKPVKDAYLHDNIPSAERATLISFESIAHHGGGMIGLVLSGLLAQHAGIRITWVIFGSMLIACTLVVAKNGSSKR
jgi:MFS family permease